MIFFQACPVADALDSGMEGDNGDGHSMVIYTDIGFDSSIPEGWTLEQSY